MSVQANEVVALRTAGGLFPYSRHPLVRITSDPHENYKPGFSLGEAGLSRVPGTHRRGQVPVHCTHYIRRAGAFPTLFFDAKAQ